jgi:hypothetical protein
MSALDIRKEHFDAQAAIHFRFEGQQDALEALSGYGNPELIANLAKLGIATSVIMGGGSYNIEDSWVKTRGVYLRNNGAIEIAQPQETVLGSGGIEAVRARVATPDKLDEMISVLNGSRLRAFGASKWRQYEAVGEFMPMTKLIRDGESPNIDIVDDMPGDKVVVKADTSQLSRYLEVCNKNEWTDSYHNVLDALVRDGKEKRDIVVQEYAPGVRWNDLVGLSDRDNSLMQQRENQELRMYCFVDSSENSNVRDGLYASARTLGKSGEDDWAFIDQDSVPDVAWDIGKSVSKKALDAAGVSVGYFAVDMFRDPKGRILVREINTRDPMMAEMDENRDEARKQRELLANLIYRATKQGDKR